MELDLPVGTMDCERVLDIQSYCSQYLSATLTKLNTFAIAFGWYQTLPYSVTLACMLVLSTPAFVDRCSVCLISIGFDTNDGLQNKSTEDWLSNRIQSCKNAEPLGWAKSLVQIQPRSAHWLVILWLSMLRSLLVQEQVLVPIHVLIQLVSFAAASAELLGIWESDWSSTPNVECCPSSDT